MASTTDGDTPRQVWLRGFVGDQILQPPSSNVHDSQLAAEKNLNTHWTPKQLIKHESTNYTEKGPFIFVRSQK